ncbi:hypothetical protein F383_22876 [Gossypium arboreum]|uniref:Uncharacterized protein n=1 Tax=Gossypium arboreum TaxID=29729 RepID=A0A0B0NS68_GOSAR|nr:hypothetical protein F383_22876 [Gossypium arboreum]
MKFVVYLFICNLLSLYAYSLFLSIFSQRRLVSLRIIGGQRYRSHYHPKHWYSWFYIFEHGIYKARLYYFVS